MKITASVCLFLSLFFLMSCGVEEKKLPYLGNPSFKGETSTYPKIPDFSFTDQENQIVNSASLENKIYIADFIFLSCSTICPLMNTEMLKVYAEFDKDDRVIFLSHTIDPANDSIQKLKAFADNLHVSSNKWHFVTGNKDSIYKIAERDYFTTAYPDSLDKDGLMHGGGLLLVDKNKNIRGVYDGTDPNETKRLILDIKQLLKEQF